MAVKVDEKVESYQKESFRNIESIIKVEVILKFEGEKELWKNFDEPVHGQNSSLNKIYQEGQK